MIKGTYRLPTIKHTFLVISVHDDHFDEQVLQKNKINKEYFAHILRSKDRICPKEIQLKRLVAISETDFLWEIEQHSPIVKVSSSLSSGNPAMLELLTMNLLKTQQSPHSGTYETCKFLGFVPDEDVIEVCI